MFAAIRLSVARSKTARTPAACAAATGLPGRTRFHSFALAIIAAGLLTGACLGQESPEAAIPALRSAGQTLIDLTALARRYGWSASDGGDALTLRTDAGILTVFDGAPDVLWQAADQANAADVPLSTPPQRSGAAWFVPEDLLQVLGIDLEGDRVPVPGGMAPLALPPAATAGDGYELAPLGAGTVGLRLFEAGAAGPDTLSLLLSDLALLALVVPEQRQVLDAVLIDGPLADGHPLLVTATALAPTPWVASLVFEQGALRFEAKHPFRFQMVAGSPEHVAPGAPAIGVILLPERFSLEEPLVVRWRERAVEVTFRPGR